MPSGDQTGCVSGPGCVTSGRTVPSATVTTEMSAVPEFERSVLMRWSKAIDAPSGDHAKPPTVNVSAVSARVARVARSMTKSSFIR